MVFLFSPGLCYRFGICASVVSVAVTYRRVCCLEEDCEILTLDPNDRARSRHEIRSSFVW